MRSERVTQGFQDIICAVDLIRKWVSEAGGVESAIHHNVLTRSAIERQLLVISEAAIRLDKIESGCASALAPGVDWAGVRGIGNFIRHRYDDLDVGIITDTISHRLDELKSGAQFALKEIERGDSQRLAAMGGSHPGAEAPPRRRPPKS